MRILNYLLNRLILLGYRRKYKKFVTLSSVELVQSEKLMEILARNQDSLFGREHGFQNIRTTADYQVAVPLSSYEDYTSYIDSIREHGDHALYCEKTLLLEKSSGSSSASKLIPYTATLKEEFGWGIAPWYYNLYTAYPSLCFGKSYWSISPIGEGKQYTKSGIPIGFDSDSGYLGRFVSFLQSHLFALPDSSAKFASMDDFRRITCMALLDCQELSFISVWNPTFLLILLEYMTKNRESLTKNKKLIALLEARDYHSVWPNLKVISCWASAHAKSYAEKIATLFPSTVIQPKGLLATECFVSFPIAGEKGSRLSVYSHFFEFISENDGKIYLSHQLRKGQCYRVVVTTSGGLYRYQLGDIIKVVADNGVPSIEFVGRSDKVSDLFGEKLSEAFVGEAVERLLKKAGLVTTFFMVAPEKNHYTLYIKSGILLEGLDDVLRENFHYDYCRKLGQLKTARVFYLSGNPEEEYLTQCTRLGQKLGDIKPTPLHLSSGWSTAFKGGYEL